MERSYNWQVTAIVVVIILALAGGAYWLGKRHSSSTPAPSPSPSISYSPTSSPTTTASASASPSPSPTSTPLTTFKNQYLEVTLAAGWTAKAVSNNPSAVNITKGGYILYINTNATQASGVEGGRFAEIAQGSPSADAVIQNWPTDPCSAPIPTVVSGNKFFSRRADLYVSSGAPSYCTVPTTGKAWYFSYLTDASNRYFNDYIAHQNPGLVVTMSYQANGVNSLPKQGDTSLTTALNEMTTMAESLTIAGR